MDNNEGLRRVPPVTSEQVQRGAGMVLRSGSVREPGQSYAEDPPFEERDGADSDFVPSHYEPGPQRAQESDSNVEKNDGNARRNTAERGGSDVQPSGAPSTEATRPAQVRGQHVEVAPQQQHDASRVPTTGDQLSPTDIATIRALRDIMPLLSAAAHQTGAANAAPVTVGATNSTAALPSRTAPHTTPAHTGGVAAGASADGAQTAVTVTGTGSGALHDPALSELTTRLVSIERALSQQSSGLHPQAAAFRYLRLNVAFKHNTKLWHARLPSSWWFNAAEGWDGIRVASQPISDNPAQGRNYSVLRTVSSWLCGVIHEIRAGADADSVVKVLEILSNMCETRASELVVLASSPTALASLVVPPLDLDDRLLPEHREQLVAERQRMLRTVYKERETGKARKDESAQDRPRRS